MTFRPSDDLLEQINSNESSSVVDQNQNENINQDVNDIWQQTVNGYVSHDEKEDKDKLFFWSIETDTNVNNNEIKAPDLSELLEKNPEKIVRERDSDMSNWNNWLEKEDENVFDIATNNTETLSNGNNMEDGENKNNEGGINDKSAVKEGLDQIVAGNSWIVDGMSDDYRYEVISKISWSIHSKLDLLVDDRRYSVVEKYKKIHRVVFRWGMFILFSVLWLVLWIMVQVYAKQPWVNYIINDSSIENRSDWVEENSNVVFSDLLSNNSDIDVKVPYGFAQVDNNSFQSKSNLISYKWIILPQISYIDLTWYDFISLDKFLNKETKREDLEKMVEYLLTADSLYSKTATLPKISDTRWEWQTFEWSLVDWFNLSCVAERKISDVVCDKFLNIFYKYGKFYDLSRYASELYVLVRELNEENKDVEPICKMVNDYILHSWKTSSIFDSIMLNCSSESKSFYKNLVDFINTENSLTVDPTRVFENSDLNAYKLLSLQQIIYRNLDTSSSVNEDLIKSYLNFVQNLINKDKWSGRYISQIYKDILYVFNADELNQKLIQKWKLSSELRMQMDQINNGNPLMDYVSLTSQLTTPDILNLSWEFLSLEVEESTLDEIFSQLYSMTDHLKIRRNSKLSDTDLQVQAEIYSDEILRVSWWMTLKTTIILHRNGNNLYVSSINISNQPDLSNMLNVYVSEWNINLSTVIWYIDEKIWFWYRDPLWESVEKTTLCEELKNRLNIDFYKCDDKSIVLYKWDVEYVFTLLNWVLESFSISDTSLESAVKERFWSILTSRENTQTIIESIIKFNVEEPEENNIEKKLEVIDQFRIHLKIIPLVSDIEWEENVFIVNFLLWDFELQANYDINTHLLTNVAYVACGKTLEINGLEIELSTNNESQLKQMLNNPRIFLSNINGAAYRKYQRMCN